MCIPLEDGVYINPSNRIGIIGECIDNCLDPQQYLWKATDTDENPYPFNPDHFPIGSKGCGVSLVVMYSVMIFLHVK